MSSDFHALVILALFAFSQCGDCQDSVSANQPFGSALNPEEKKYAVGPWGNLEFYPLILESSDFFVSRSKDLLNWGQGTVWRFSAMNSAGVEGVFKDAGISSKLRDELLSDQYMSFNKDTDVYEIRPPEHLIIALTSENRRILYPQILPQNDDNPFYSAFALPVGGLDAVTYVSSGVPQEQIDLIRALSFKKGRTNRFSDINLVFSKAKTDYERWRILKTIGRERSLSVKLRISEDHNLSQLANYWSAGGKNKEILPILESVMMTSGIETLDLIHLLPPTPRKLLHTYPSPAGDGIGREMPDCNWTAASFFSEEPPERYLDLIGQVLENRYEIATRPLQLGDIILLSDKSSGKPIHACNYIAGNLVFTKNGMSMGRPWTISSLEDVIEVYLSVESLSLGFRRLKPQYQK